MYETSLVALSHVPMPQKPWCSLRQPVPKALTLAGQPLNPIYV